MPIQLVQASPRLAAASSSPTDITGVFRPVTSPLDYHGLYDGVAHTLAELFSTAADAQAYYSATTAALAAASEPALSLSDTVDYAATMEAGWRLPNKGGLLVLPPGLALVSRGLVFGNGSLTEGSTKNGIQIIGQGIGGIYQTPTSGFIYEQPSRACVISPSQSISTPILTLRGRMYGAAIKNVVLDAGVTVAGVLNYWAPTCLQVYHVINSDFDFVQCRGGTQWCVRAEIANTAGYDYWSCDNHWRKLSIQARGSGSGLLFADSGAPYGQQGDLCRHFFYGLDISGTNGTQTAIQIGMCDSCWFEHVSIYGFAAAKQLVIRPQAAAPQYPENITLSDLMCGGGMDNNTADPDNFWTIDESLVGGAGGWTAGDHKITIAYLHQESGNPAFPSDSRFKGFSKDGVFYNGWGGGSSSGIVRTHYDLAAGSNSISAPSGSPDQQVISIKQNASANGTVSFNSIYKFTENFLPDLRANRRSIYTFVKAGSEYHLISAIVGVL